MCHRNVQQFFGCRLVSLKFIIIVALVTAPETCSSLNKNIQNYRRSTSNIVYLSRCPEAKLNSGQRFYIPASQATFNQVLIFSIKSIPFEGCPTANFLYSFDHKDDSTLATLKFTGLLQLGNEYYSQPEFCVNEWKGSRIEFRICKPTCQGKTPCIIKCCSIGKSLTFGDETVGQGCVKNNGSGEWKLKFFEDPWTRVSDLEWSKLEPHVTTRPPHCTFPNGTVHHLHESWPSIDVPQSGIQKLPIRLRKDGNLLRLSKERSWVVVPRNTFCIDDLLVPEAMARNDIVGRPIIVIKCENQKEETGRRLSIVYIVAMFVSAFFLLLTAIVYIILWDKLCTSVHGWTVLSYVSSAFFLYILLAISHVLGLVWDEWDHNYSGTTFCMFIGATIHLFFISTFSFLTLLNFDVWLTFRSHTPIGERSKGTRRFIFYNLFAWGLSTVVVTVGFILDNVYPDIESEVIVPQYGYVNCFMATWAFGYYVYTIIGVLLAINLIFIALTVRTIYEFRKTTSMIPHSPHESFKLFLKIFVVCGLTWIFEIVSWLSSREKTKLHWMLLDCINILQAIGIFAIFICKKKTIKQLQQKFAMCNDTSKYLCCCNLQKNAHRASSTEQSTGTTGTSNKQRPSCTTSRMTH